MLDSQVKENENNGIDILYNSLIQSCIESYVQNIIKRKERTISINEMLTYFSSIRSKIAYIMNTVSDKLNYNYFCKKEDLADFGVERKNIIVTPLNGRYKSSFLELKGNQTSIISLDDNIKFAQSNINLYSESAYRKQIMFNNISLSYVHYEYNENEFSRYGYLSRCIYHSALDNKQELIKRIDIFSDTVMNSDSKFYDNLLYLVWILSQLTIFKRGSASITEMIVCAIAKLRAFHIYNKNETYKVKKGVDLLAIYSDLQEFTEKCKEVAIISIDDETEQVEGMTIEDLEGLHNKLFTMSKEEIRCAIELFKHSKKYSLFRTSRAKNFESNIKDITNNLSDIL